MSARRHNQAEVCVWNELVGEWADEGTNEECGPETGVFARRVPKDSYTHERPLLSASWTFLAADLIEIDSVDADEDGVVHLLPTLRP